MPRAHARVRVARADPRRAGDGEHRHILPRHRRCTSCSAGATLPPRAAGGAIGEALTLSDPPPPAAQPQIAAAAQALRGDLDTIVFKDAQGGAVSGAVAPPGQAIADDLDRLPARRTRARATGFPPAIGSGSSRHASDGGARRRRGGRVDGGLSPSVSSSSDRGTRPPKPHEPSR